jgi:hypothetical protein
MLAVTRAISAAVAAFFKLSDILLLIAFMVFPRCVTEFLVLLLMDRAVQNFGTNRRAEFPAIFCGY